MNVFGVVLYVCFVYKVGVFLYVYCGQVLVLFVVNLVMQVDVVEVGGLLLFVIINGSEDCVGYGENVWVCLFIMIYGCYVLEEFECLMLCMVWLLLCGVIGLVDVWMWCVQLD